MSIVSKARTAFGHNIQFDVKALIGLPTDSLPKDVNNKTNCLNYIAWAGDIDIINYPFPRIDYLCETLPKVEIPSINNLIAYPSTPSNRSWKKFVPGCIAIISEVQGTEVSKIIIAHPKVSGIIDEVSPDLFFKDKNFVLLEVS